MRRRQPLAGVLCTLVLSLGLLLTVGCAGLVEDLGRAQSAYDAAAYEDAAVWLASVEPDIPRATRPDRARFYYLRGMTAFRVGDRARARHYLALARAEAGDEGIGLAERWPERLERTLALLRDEIPR